MLTSLHINRFRSCQDVRLTSLTDITALVGRNGAGKTNILQAFDWLARIVTGGIPTSANRKPPESGRMSAEIELDGKPYWYSVTRSVSLERGADGQVVRNDIFEEELTRVDLGETIFKRVGERVDVAGRAGTPTLVGIDASTIVGLISLLPETDDLRSTLLRMWAFFSRVSYYPLTDLAEADDVAVILASDFNEWLSSPRSWKSTDAQGTVMRIIRMSSDDAAAFEELKTLLGPDHLDLIWDIQVLKIPTKPQSSVLEKLDSFVYFVDFVPSGHSASFSFDKLSFGTKRIIQLVVSMLADGSSISLIEQPEDGIHPALLHKLIPFVRNYSEGNQVVLASHSPAVLNSVEPEELRLIEMANGRTFARSLTATEVEAANNYLARSGPLADFIDAL